jgi:acetylglutamate kinase
MNPLVIKIGGAILEKPSALTALFGVIKQLRQQPVVLVHGGGIVVDQLTQQAGFTTEKFQGLRVTPPQQIPLISGALAGYVNKTLVATAQQSGLNAVGLSLLDGNMTWCKPVAHELQAVGKPVVKSSKLLDGLLALEMLPIVSSIGVNSVGELVNVNADDAAVAVAQLLNAELLLLSDVNGVKNHTGDYLKQLDQSTAEQLIEAGVIAGGMIAKVRAAFDAANQLRRSIAVASWQQPEQIVKLLQGEAVGTRILSSSSAH